MRYIFTFICFLTLSPCFSQVEPELILNKKDSLVENFAQRLEDAFYEGNDDFILINSNSLYFKRYIIIEEEDNDELKEFNSSFFESLGNPFIEIFQSIVPQIEAGYSYNFVNYSEDADHNYYIRFRLFGEDGLNYHEYFIPNQDNDLIEISDVFFLLTGEFFSDTMFPLYSGFAKEFINDEENLYANGLDFESLKTLGEIRSLNDQDKTNEARRKLKAIYKKYSENKLVNYYKLLLSDVTDKDYEKTLKLLEEESDFLATISLLSLNKYIYAKQFDEALKAIDVIEDYSGDDFLDFYRANVYYQMGDIDMAEKYYRYFSSNYPYSFEGYNNLIAAFIFQKKFPEMIEQFEKILEFTSLTKDEIIEVYEEYYPEILESEDYLNWKSN